MNMKAIVKDALILCVITLISGLALGFVHDITAEPIRKVQEQAKQTAYQNVFKDAQGEALATDFKKLDEKMIPEDQFAEVLANAGIEKDIVTEVAYAMKDGVYVGLVFNVTAKDGYGGDIEFTVGILKDGTVNDISLLSISETAGLGMNAKEDSFQAQYRYKNIDEFVVTKSDVTADNQISAISGATITSRAITKGVNSAIQAFNYLNRQENNLEGGASVE